MDINQTHRHQQFPIFKPPHDQLKEGEEDDDAERKACTSISPKGFHFRPPPSPSALTTFITPDTSLFQTIHMGAAVIDPALHRLVITGLVHQPLVLTLPSLLSLFPRKSLTSFHECYGSPLKPPTEFVRRVGNVTWTGIPLKDILSKAGVKPEGKFVWSDGLDHGIFGGVEQDRYRKDLTIEKALSGEVMVAFGINGEELDKERGGPLRLVVPGWFGTNSTKWLCRLTVADRRAEGAYTTRFYNELVPGGKEGEMRPVWGVEPSSILVVPGPGKAVEGSEVEVWGWAWSWDGIEGVGVRVDGGGEWLEAKVKGRVEFEWQRFELNVRLGPGKHSLSACATSKSGISQPLAGRRNHVHTIDIVVC